MRAIVVDDHPLVRSGLKLLLQRHGLADEILEVGAVADAAAALEEGGADLLLVDLQLPDAAGVEAVSNLARLAPGVPILVVSGDVQSDTIDAAFAAGARGFLPKDSSGDVLLLAIQTVLRGQFYVPPHAIPSLTPPPAASSAAPEPSAEVHLTPRQRDVLRHLARGLGNREIAAELDLSYSTVRVHVSAILRALSVANRIQAAQHPAALALLGGA